MNNDTISRQAAIDEMQEYWRTLNLRRKRIPLAAEAVYMDLKGVVATLPSAERRGRWINGNEGNWNAVIVPKCSICGETFYEMNVNINGEYTYNYCPNCGAKMREKKNECDDCFIPMFYNLEDDDSICRDCEVGE